MVLLAGCSLGDDDSGTRGARSPAPSEEVDAIPPAAQRILEFPSCNGSSVPERWFLGKGWRRRITRIGPVRLLRVDDLADADLARRRPYIVRALFPPSHSITIGIEGEARSRVGFLELGAQQWSGSASDLYPALLIEDCPELPRELGELPAGRLYGFTCS
jgi:hypothetical protein